MSLKIALEPGRYQVTWYFKEVPALSDEDVHKDTEQHLNPLRSLMVAPLNPNQRNNLTLPMLRVGWNPPSSWVAAQWNPISEFEHRRSALNKIVDDPLIIGLYTEPAIVHDSIAGEFNVTQKLTVNLPVSRGYIHYMEWNVERYLGNLLFGGVTVARDKDNSLRDPECTPWSPFNVL